MNKTFSIILRIILVLSIIIFCYLMYAWNYAFSTGTYSDEHGFYSGEFKGKIFDGYGVFKFANGITYEGEWVDGRMEGHGIMTFIDGSHYEGQFVDGMFNGSGKMINKEGSSVEGDWHNGELIIKQN